MTASEFFQSVAPFVDYLAGRWQDEQEYEDFAEYRAAVEKKMPDGFTLLEMKKKPFSFKFSAPDNLVYRIKVKGNKIVMEQ